MTWTINILNFKVHHRPLTLTFWTLASEIPNLDFNQISNGVFKIYETLFGRKSTFGVKFSHTLLKLNWEKFNDNWPKRGQSIIFFNFTMFLHFGKCYWWLFLGLAARKFKMLLVSWAQRSDEGRRSFVYGSCWWPLRLQPQLLQRLL